MDKMIWGAKMLTAQKAMAAAAEQIATKFGMEAELYALTHTFHNKPHVAELNREEAIAAFLVSLASKLQSQPEGAEITQSAAAVEDDKSNDATVSTSLASSEATEDKPRRSKKGA